MLLFVFNISGDQRSVMTVRKSYEGINVADVQDTSYRGNIVVENRVVTNVTYIQMFRKTSTCVSYKTFCMV
jgi:hypothetical protein